MKLLKMIWVYVNEPTWSSWQVILWIGMAQMLSALGYYDVGIEKVATAGGVLAVSATLCVVLPLWIWGLRTGRREWNVGRRRRRE